MNDKTYDIAIIGAGPAGATLARLLSQTYSIALIDRRNLTDNEKPRAEKCCGGLIAPDAQEMLATFGMAVPRSVCADPQLFAVRTFDSGCKTERTYVRSYINIDRELFDRWLVASVHQTVTLFMNTTIRHIERTDTAVILNGHSPKGSCSIKARIVIGADGARSHIRRFCSSQSPEPKTYIAIQGSFELTRHEPFFTAVFAPELTDFYGWTIPKNGSILAGIALPVNGKTLQAYDAFITILRNRYEFLGNEIVRNGAYIYRPSGFNDIMTGDSRIALVGEAAGFISPSSAEGFSFAFKSALMLAQALNCGLDGFAERYRRLTLSLKRSIVAKTIKSPFMYTPWLRRTILRTGIKSLSIIR